MAEEKEYQPTLRDRTAEFAQEELTDDLQNAEDDDARVIFNMNVEGMPGYRPDLDRQLRAGKGLHEQLSKNETWQIIKASLFAGLCIAGAFSAVIILLVLFCTKIWFA